MEEFELKYNEITNRKRNVFYFQYYCYNPDEFRDWLIYNELSLKDFKLLNNEFQNIYIEHIYKIMLNFLTTSFYKCSVLEEKQIQKCIDEIQILMNKFSYYTCFFDKTKKINIINKIKQFLLIYPGYIILI